MMIDLTEDTPVTPAAKPKQQVPWLLIAVIVIAGYLYFSKQAPSPSPNPDDQTIIVDDENQPSPQPQPQPSIDLKDATLVFVLEAIAPTAEQTNVMLSVTTQSLQARGMKGFRRYDEEQPEVQELVDLAVSKNTPSPFVAILKDKAILRLASFPKTPAELEAFLR